MYYVIIDGEKILTKNKKEANNLLIDAFLSGKQNIDWRIYENETWVILKEVRKWEFVECLNSFCWVEKRIEYLHKAHTKEQCEQAWIELGFEFNPNHLIQCKDMKADGIWTRYIIQKTNKVES